MPQPTVEDEAESLAKEAGSPSVSAYPDETPQSRGEIEQESIMEEVHEHNPERRFVVVTDQPKPESKQSSETNPSRFRRTEKPLRDPVADTPRDRLYEPVFDDRAGFDDRSVDPRLSRRASERRKSRNDLPRIDTNLMPDRRQQRPRTKSAVGGSRPDFYGDKPSRPRDGLLSPEIIQHGPNRPEKSTQAYSSSAHPSGRPSHTRSLSNTADDRRYDDRSPSKDYFNKGGTSPSSSRRQNSTYHASNRSDRHDRYLPSERVSEPRKREDAAQSRSHRRDASKSYSQAPDDDRRGVSTGRSRESRPRREDSRSSDEYSRRSKPSGRRRRESVVIQDERRSAPTVINSTAAPRAPSREPSVPISTQPSLPSEGSAASTRMSSAAMSGAAALGAGAAAAAAAAAADRTPAGRSHPYSQTTDGYVTDGSVGTNMSERRPAPSLKSEASVDHDDPGRSMSSRNGSEAQPSTTITPASPKLSAADSPQTWQPGSFVPERDGLPVDKPVGSYRKYSENLDSSGPPRLPECRFTKPVIGHQGWLTLPRSDFHICTECYAAVFADTTYGTQFQPMFYALDKPISCDFGASPWYRIAWLLTLRSETQDLRLFYSISQIATMCRNQPCPGDKRATRCWFTILDPVLREPVPNFAVCLQCAKTIESLLPNMGGVFVPWDPRSEPSRDTCALHYKPQREEFVLYFDVLETTADAAHISQQPLDMDKLCRDLGKLSMSQKCRKDEPVRDGWWHFMQYLPNFTVCGKCFEQVVQPRIDEGNLIARNFFMRPQLVPETTCQLYSDRMREVFRKACRREDAEYLAGKVRERARKEEDIHRKLERLDRKGHDSKWTAEQVQLLVDEWKLWE